MPIDSDNFMDSPKSVFHKFLPCNNIDDDDPYSSEQFRMYEFKVRKCTRSRSHDWTHCPFAHPGEKARRRDPRIYHYSGTVCPEFRRGQCSRGENCEFAHGVFECWLHPSRYRTEACKDGKNCKRNICFFAHSSRQLRLLPIENPSSPVNSPSFVGKKNRNINPCCVYRHSRVASPKSTLMEMCHASSPMSPARFSPVSRFKDQCGHVDPDGVLKFSSGRMSYKDAMIELMNSIESMQLNYEPTSPIRDAAAAAAADSNIIPWVNVNFNGEDRNQVFSSPSRGTNKFVGGGNFSNKNLSEESENNFAEPDLGWVNDLLV